MESLPLPINYTAFTDRLCKYTCSLFLFAAVLFAGNKQAAAYCTPVATSTTYYISNFTTTGAAVNVNNTSGGGAGTGYTDFTATQNITAMQSTVVNFSASGGGGGTYVWRIYVDWDQNGTFDPAELMYTNGTSYVSGVTGSFTVPTTALSGVTRLRVFGDYWSPTGAPCNFNTTYGATGEVEDYSFTVGALPPCAGTPTPGTAASTVTGSCANVPFTLSTTGATVASLITYQWQSSPTGAAPWTDIAGANATSYSTTQTVATYYRFKIICNGTDSAFSNILNIPVNAPNQCYCIPPATYASYYISSFSTTNGITNITNNGTGAGITSLGYSNYLSKSCSAYAGGLPMNFSVASNSDPGYKIWIDFNQDGVFATSELVYSSTAYATSATGTLTIPASATLGTTRMRVRTDWLSTTGPIDPCSLVAYSEAEDYTITIVQLPPCTGRPTAGTIVPVTPCPGVNFNLSLTGGTSPYSSGGLMYQWEDSSAGGWLPSLGATATTPVYTTSITTATRYRCIVTCSYTGQIDTSAAYTVNLASFLTCYCGSSLPLYSNDDDIGNVTINTTPGNTVVLNNGVATPLQGNSTSTHTYTNFTALPPTSLFLDSAYTIALTQINSGSFYTCLGYAYIDYNHNGIFDANELVLSQTTSTSSVPSQQVHQNFTVPSTAKIGLTRMRVILNEGATQPDPCVGYYYGETEDYMVNINYPPCNGPTNAGVAAASETSICKGYTINLWDTTHEYHRSSISWSWQQTLDGGLTWTPIANSANKDTLNDVLINAPISFRVKMSCDVTGDSTFSVPANITIKAPYQCYCYSQSNGGPTDTADIGAFVIGDLVNSTGGPHIMNPTAIRRRTDYTSIPNVVMYANHAYHLSIYHIQRTAFHADARVSVFVDYDNNLVYDVNAQPNSERVYTGISTESNFYIDTMLHVPDAVIPNVPTGLRVILNNDLNPNSPANLGCGPYGSGETEDYVVQFRRTPQGVGGVMNLETVTLYPNPTSGRFTIVANAEKSLDKVEVTVTTISGQMLQKKTYENVGVKFAEEVDLSEVAKGMYFVELKAANGDKMVRKLTVR